MDQLDRYISESLNRLFPRVQDRFQLGEKVQLKDWSIFERRIQDYYPRLFKIYYHLYGHRHDFYFHLEDLLDKLAGMWIDRPDDLKKLDTQREQEPLWFQSQSMVGGVCYVDLFAGSLAGIKDKIPYFTEIGITYFHLMPVFKVPPGENDGGYAVSSYREINPELGTTEELVDLAKELRRSGISLVLDFVFNHTSEDHSWANQAKKGDINFQEFYRMFPDRKLPDAYECHLREIFPDEKRNGIRTGSFTYVEKLGKWVWTTFRSYQWDLNYENPAVFNCMLEDMLYLANVGVEILRLDAVAFIWKKLGTDCENLPEAHMLIQAFNAAARISAPALLFKSEAIVHPDEVIKYISVDECQISYNPLLMALLWNSLATRQVKLLRQALTERYKIGDGCAWVNYVRSHDDIGWTFSDEDALKMGINAFDHREFLNQFYSGQFPGSFGLGLLFQINPSTGDARISGTCASLAGLEKALQQNSEKETDLAIKRILLLHGIIMTAGGIPLIYFGDEIATVNDYSFRLDDSKSQDNRWVHRPFFDWNKAEKRRDTNTIEGRVFNGIRNLIDMRKNNNVFAGNKIEILNTGSDHILGYLRVYQNIRAIVLCNFSEEKQTISGNFLRLFGFSTRFINLGSGEIISSVDLLLEPYDFVCLMPHQT